MRARATKIAAGVVASIVLIAVLAALELRPIRSEIVADDSQAVELPEPGSAIVTVLRESGGLSLLGLRIKDATHHVEVQFLAGPGCAELLNGGDPWPTRHPECTAPIDIVGYVGGLGITQSGDSLVGVQFEVPRACFEQLVTGMAWPPDLPECALP